MAKLLSENKTELVKKASLLNLSAKTLAENLRSGNFKSLYRGQGIEFNGVREYNPGDNVRSIDWNVSARLARPFIKQYEEDRELHVFFVLDRSVSMFCGSNKKSKIETASNAAALLVLACLINNSSIGAVFFDGKIRFSAKASAGKEHAMMILSHLDEVDERIEKGSVLSNALTGAIKILKKRSMVFVISDFRTTGWETPLARLAVRNDVIALRITDPSDSELPEIGNVAFVDMESGERKRFSTSSKDFKSQWFEDNRQRVENWKSFCIRHGAYPLCLSTTEEPFLVLNQFFMSRGEK